MKLFINSFEIELEPNVVIAKTLQVNDIGSVETRQSSYTNTFNIPKTSKNTKALNMLGIVGNDSNIPYQKNECYLYSDSGECIVYKGWADITETSSTYMCNIYDGIIDLYKAIDNKTLADLDLTALAHDKTPTEVNSTQSLTKPYVYILADYNGKAKYDNKINTDFLVPAVKASWIMDRIQDFTGFTFNGNFKTNPDYTNLYLTYPKASPPTIGAELLFDDTISGYETGINTTFPVLTPTTYDTTKLQLLDSGKKIKALVDIKIRVTFTINTTLITPYPTGIFLGQVFECNGTLRTLSRFYVLNAGDEISFPFAVFYEEEPDFPISVLFFSCSIKELTNAVLFEEEFAGMTIKQFMNEILWRFNLTIFNSKYSKDYTFKYLSEIINATPIDWSDKFQDLENENYIYGSYGQRSWLRLRYNDSNSFFNDGYVEVQNANLPDSKTVIQSSTYSHEFNPTGEIGFTSNLYPFWSKEVKEGTDLINYKPLSNRFYFMRCTPITLTDTSLTSEELGLSEVISTAQKESALGLGFNSIVESYYPDLKSLINKSKVLTATMRLNEQDIININFSIPVYIKQLGGSFLINKISNYIPFKDVKVELIKISK